MPVPALVLALVLAAVIATSRSRADAGWAAFGGWLVAGFLSALASISFAVGLLVLPFAVVAIVIASRFGLWPPVLGFAAGAGLIGVLVWMLSLVETGGPTYVSWLAVGTALALASTTAFLLRRG